jgi:peptidoglycan hydrolase-like protein with peptidoglycan-binding domain
MSDVTGQGQSEAPDVDFAALQPGQKIGRYEIVSILGQGGFGITYRALDSQLNREVAIKEYLPSALAVRQDGITVLPRSTKMSDDFTWGRQRFVDEGRTLATLGRAPAIVRVFDFLEANGTAYIVMELVPGRTLEDRLKGGKTLAPADVDKIIWPLLDGLEQVHATGFLHRDIKPANILLDDAGNPTLIDFGASRAAMAGRTTAMTAIFTPGYAAAEQFTSAKQGQWTDIYGLSATLYHAITGATPPSAFDRMLDDEYRPLSKLAPEGFASGLLVGIDVGLTVRSSERPQSIAGWRGILTQTGPIDPNATIALGKTADPNATIMVRKPAPAAAPPPAKRGPGLWIGLAAVLVALAGGGGYFMMAKKPVGQVATAEVESAEAKAARAQTEELAKLRQEKEARDRADSEAAAKRKSDEEAKAKAAAEAEERRQIEADTRKKIEAEMAAKQKADDESRLKAQAEEEAKRKAEENDRRAAEAGELALRFSVPDRQHIQVALTSLGFNTNGTDGVFGGHTRDMVAAWQKGHNYPATGFLTGPENQALLRDAGPAISKFDDEQKKAEEAKKKADEEKAKADASAKATAPASQPAAGIPPATNMAAAAQRGPNGDGLWHGSYRCTPAKGGSDFNINIQIRVSGGTGTWVRPGSGPGTTGNQSITITIRGNLVAISRNYSPEKALGQVMTAQMSAHYDGANAITGGGAEAYSGGRSCEINFTRQ